MARAAMRSLISKFRRASCHAANSDVVEAWLGLAVAFAAIACVAALLVRQFLAAA